MYQEIHTLEGHSGKIYQIIEMKDGKLCSCSEDKTIKIWDDTNNYQCIQTLTKHEDGVNSILEINNYIISSSNGADKILRIWNKSTYECVKTMHQVSCYSENGLTKLQDNIVILGSYGKLFIVDVLTFQLNSFINMQIGSIRSICVLKNGKVLLGNAEGIISCFDPLSEKIIFNQFVHNNCITSIIEDKNNKIFSSSYVHIINIYDKPCFI